MEAIEPQLPRAVDLDARWIPGPFARDDLLRGLLDGGMAGVVSHPMDNVLWKIGLLCDGDDMSQFGMIGVDRLSRTEVLELVAEASGFEPDPRVRLGPVRVTAERILAACEEAGDRLALACERSERMILATGHPTGPILLCVEIGRLLARHGVTLLRPREGFSWDEGAHSHRQVRYLHGVAVLTDRAAALHTHSAAPMRMMLEESRPDLVFADHGFAGAAIEAGIETLSIADVNDPALLVAKAMGRTSTVIVMDDNVQPEAYWPCFQAMAARISARLG
jgi:histidinol phosphate phosphatase hisN-like protein